MHRSRHQVLSLLEQSEPVLVLANQTAKLPACLRPGIAMVLGLAAAHLGGVAQAQTGKPFMDYIKPMPITCSPLSSETWGVDGVLPRDLCNGMESALGAGVPPEYYYWDGQIIRGEDGRYHMFMSTWSGAEGFNPGWLGSDAFHAISEQGVLGPYRRQDYIYTTDGSHKGHNVTALELPDGTYAVVVSETVPFTIYTSSSLSGPWESCRPTIQVSSSNVSLFPRHDGRFQVVERYGNIAISDTLCGTYVKQRPTCSYPTDNADTIYPSRDSIPRVDNPTFDWQEDPHIWRSGGVYHVIYSGSGDRVGWHLYSLDGINDWQDNGYAWSPREYERIFCYEGSSVCNQWYKMERPGVVLEDGHPTHLTWAVADVDKDFEIPGNSNHGSKIIVIPFDGVTFDNDFGGGGRSGEGGVPGAGGSGEGGALGTGGSGEGGAMGEGGANPTGGAPATGGSGEGGAPGTGGASQTGGTGAGGQNGAGGTPTTGGTNQTGGAAGSGGANSGGSSGNTGGATATSSGGTLGSGGSSFGGASTGTGPGGANAGLDGSTLAGGGAVSAGASGSGVGGQIGGSVGTAGAKASLSSEADSSSGCSCTIPGAPHQNSGAWLWWLGSAPLALLRRRRAQHTK